MKLRLIFDWRLPPSFAMVAVAVVFTFYWSVFDEMALRGELANRKHSIRGVT